MKFNFECWALVEICYPHEEDSSLDKIRGFWATKAELACGRDAIEAQRRIAHEKREDEHKRKFSFMGRLDYQPAVYVSVPLSQMQFKDLEEAEEMILKAARLAFKGCGVAGNEVRL
jgi:hypothetical protein